jgi:hypothetical protein
MIASGLFNKEKQKHFEIVNDHKNYYGQGHCTL